MLAFLQEDMDQLLIKTDEREEMLFKETYKYMYVITNCIWMPSLAGGLIALMDTFYRFAFNPDSIFNLEEVSAFQAQGLADL